MQSQGLSSLSSKTHYHQLSSSIEAARLDALMIASLWNLTGAAAHVPVDFQSDFQSDQQSLNLNLAAASRLHEILW